MHVPTILSELNKYLNALLQRRQFSRGPGVDRHSPHNESRTSRPWNRRLC